MLEASICPLAFFDAIPDKKSVTDNIFHRIKMQYPNPVYNVHTFGIQRVCIAAGGIAPVVAGKLH